MPKPNDELLARVLEDQPPALTSRQRFREATARWFQESKHAHAFFGVLLGLLALAMLYRGGLVLRAGLQADRADLIVGGYLMLMVGPAFLLFSILWSRMARYKDTTLEQLLLLRLELSQLASEPSADSPEAGARVELASLLPDMLRGEVTSPWRRVGRRIVVWVSGLMFIAFTAAGVLALTLSPLDRRGPAITQVDQWQITAGDTVAAHSRIRFERPFASSHFVTLALPYPPAEITSVTSEGQALRFSKLDWRRLEVELPIGSFPWRPPEIFVTWEFPLDYLASVEGGYRTVLCALMPVDSYRLEVVVDDKSGYEVVGQPESRRLVPFQSGKSGRRVERAFFGACQIGVQKKAEQ